MARRTSSASHHQGRGPALTIALLLSAALAAPLAQSPALDRELRRIFQSSDYATETFGPAVWLEDGRSYGVIERAADGARVLVAYDAGDRRARGAGRRRDC